MQILVHYDSRYMSMFVSMYMIVPTRSYWYGNSFPSSRPLSPLPTVWRVLQHYWEGVSQCGHNLIFLYYGWCVYLSMHMYSTCMCINRAMYVCLYIYISNFVLFMLIKNVSSWLCLCVYDAHICVRVNLCAGTSMWCVLSSTSLRRRWAAVGTSLKVFSGMSDISACKCGVWEGGCYGK